MKNFLIAFVVFVLWSFFALWLYSWLQPNAMDQAVNAANQQTIEDRAAIQNTQDQAVTDSVQNIEDRLLTETIENRTEGLKAVGTDGKLIFLYPRGFSIEKSSPDVIIPEELKGFGQQLKDVIDDQPQTELHIYSQYSPSEDVYMPNLGVQRARKITQMLVNLGVPNNRLVIKPQIIPIQFDASNTYQSSFSFALKPLDSLRLNALRSNLPESRTIYPTYTFDGVLVNKDLRDFGKELKEMVINQPDLKIEVIGHTDNVGNAQDNYLKALDHARQVRWYLIKSSGIDKGRVKAKSMGETEAIAGNGSKNGRELNRRIEIKFYLDNVN